MVEDKTIRSIQVNHENHGFSSNAVHNTKYKWWSFIFCNLFEQLIQPLNAYFVLIACLEFFPIIRAYNPWTTWIPIIWIFTLTAIRAAIEDIGRYRQDKLANNRLVRVLRGDLLVEIKSQDLQVGDVVYIEEGEEIPCDLVVLASSDPSGCCYIQTMNIDGETNLKLRKIPTNFNTIIQGTKPEEVQSSINQQVMSIRCEAPNSHIYRFTGNIKVNDTEYSLSSSNLLLQVTRLENTQFIFGAVVYTGHETKFGQNKSKPVLKLAVSDKMTSVFTLVIAIIQIFMILIVSPIGVSLNKGNEQWYLEKVDAAYEAIIPLRFLLLNSGMVPSTLKVTLELIKILYSTFIHYDEHFRDDKKKSRVGCNSIALCETLGNIRYLFTDKTGTLTKNELVLRELYVGDSLTTVSSNATEYGVHNPSSFTETELNRQLATCVLVCNSCVRVDTKLKSDNPDELALLCGLQSLGCVIESTVDKTVTIRMGDAVEKWTVLKVVAFTSDRKRMSVVVHNEATKAIFMYTKGADEVLVPLFLSNEVTVNNQVFNCGQLKDWIVQNVNQVSKKGYRSLVYGVRPLTEEQWVKLNDQINQSEITLNNREECVEAALKDLEKDLIPLGVSGIEDSLQDSVKETIRYFTDCGIQIWLVTGDQVNTAVNISRNCGIVRETDTVIVMNSHDAQDIQKQIQMISTLENPKEHSVVITGAVLASVLHSDKVKVFVKSLLKVNSIICSRVTPKQKADIVLEVKKHTKEMTMAVGDGGNDVNMIFHSHCGVGVSGKEGQQAARAGDFVITEFSDLKRLICVHGVNNYSRSWSITSYSLYKSIVLCACQIMYSFYTLFSGASLFNSFHLTYYSIALFIPIAGLVFKRVYPDEQLLNNPSIYAYYNNSSSYHSTAYSVKMFIFWFILGIIQGFILMLVSIYGLRMTDRDFTSEFVFFSIYSLQDLMLFIIVPNVVGVQTFIVLLMHFLIWGLTWLQSAFDKMGSMVPYMSLNFSMEQVEYWLGRILILFLAVIPYVCIRVFQNKKFNFYMKY